MITSVTVVGEADAVIVIDSSSVTVTVTTGSALVVDVGDI